VLDGRNVRAMARRLLTADEEVLDMECGDVARPPASGGPEHQPSEGRRLDRILVATDGSTRSEHAIRFAVELASKYQSEVLLVHVIPIAEGGTTAGFAEVGDAVPQTPTEPDQATVLKDAVAIAREHDVTAKSTLLVGAAAAAIVAYAESHDVNMIVVGSRGNGANAPLGRVSLDVLRTSQRPLLIVDGDNSITVCGNGSCREVRMYGRFTTNDASRPARPQVTAVGGGTRNDLMPRIKWSPTRVTSGVPDAVAHSPSRGSALHHRPSSGNPPAGPTSERGRIPSLLALLSGATRLETIVLVAEDVWGITATIPYEGVILLAQFTTRDSACEWFAVAKALVGS
jgi:nucleotide-binding universal stress UspA family protein